ncbi:MAG: dihydroneopterin aldolase [Nodosilinea sp.]
MDCIYITGIRGYGYIGYLPEEKVLGQWFGVDLRLWVDITEACQSDNIAHTLDYRSVISLVKDLVKTSKFDLLERLAGEIASQILSSNNRLFKVQVTVHKPAPPIPDFNGSISIEITRSKD